MNVTRVQVPQREQYLAQVDRLLNSHVLHGSESLCKLLRYLAKHALDHPGAPLKEYQIATEVFGRQTDFDPQVDSMVRVQAGRLRSKLAEYYAPEGAEDPTWVELPKGTYVLTFHHGAPGSARNHSGASVDPRHELRHEPGFPPGTPRKWIATVVVLSALLAAALFTAGFLFLQQKNGDVKASGDIPQAPAAFHIFWKGFITGPDEPWVIFSNAAFTGRPDIGM